MDLDHALSRCPFLHNLVQAKGRAYATSIAVNPLIRAPEGPLPSSARRPILEEETDFAATFRLFHGTGGAFPLAQSSVPSNPPPCSVVAPTAVRVSESPPDVTHRSCAVARHPLVGAPLATMSLGQGMPDFGELFRRLQRHAARANKPPQQRPPNNSSGAGRGDVVKPARASGRAGLQPPTKTPRVGPASPSGPAPAPQPGPGESGGLCPLRKFLGPTLSGMVLDKAGHIACPEVIVQARAALAATAPVRALRPQALQIKLAACVAIAALVNMPCGMVREHTTKFSWQWVVAVHASVPFVAMLRKAVIMPKMAILFTIAAAIAGQQMGARMERERMQKAAALELAAAPPAPRVLRAATTTTGGQRTVRMLRGSSSSSAARSRAGSKSSSSVMAMAAPAALDGWCMGGAITGSVDMSFKQLLALPAPIAIAARA
ncbi:hypothetical protein FOA52_001397 [Chlamydomonas sp. UWO 241]|nr:hypothetical protein FOA52_001397 [Chlamydomonas sp. UWO 241]